MMACTRLIAVGEYVRTYRTGTGARSMSHGAWSIGALEHRRRVSTVELARYLVYALRVFGELEMN